MTSIETVNLKQFAVYWPYVGRDPHGEPVVGDPVEVPCRYEAGMIASIQESTEPIGSPAIFDIDRDMMIGGRLWPGRLADLAGTGQVITGAFSITDFNKIPDIKGRKFQRYVTVTKLGNILVQ